MLLGASFRRPTNCASDCNHSDTGLDPRIRRRIVGIHIAPLTERRRLMSRTINHVLNARDKNNAIDAIC